MNLRAHALPLAALFAAAFALRLWGIDFGLPQKTEDDCMIPYQVEALYDESTSERVAERDYNWYPLLLARVAALWPEPALAEGGAPLAEHLTAAKRLHLRTRATLAAIACLAVPLTWLLARLWLSAGWSYLAAALVATSLLHLSFSQQARPHAPASALFLAAVLAGVWVRRAGRLPQAGWLPHAAAALAACAAVGCLQSGLLCLPALALGYAWRAGGLRRLADGRALFPLAGAAAALALFYPFLWAGDFGRREEQTQVFDLGGHMIFLDQFNGRGFAVVARSLWSYDPVLLVLCGLALVLAALRPLRGRGAGARPERADARDAWIALSFCLPYLAVCGLYERTYERFVIALVPYAAVAAAFGARGLARIVPAPAVAMLALALPLAASCRLASARAAPDTLEEAAAWVAANVDPSEKVLLTSKVDLPLGRTLAGLEYLGWAEPLASRRYSFLPWSHYLARLAQSAGPAAIPEPRFDLHWLPVDQQAYLEDAAGFIAARRAEYAVAEVFGDGRQAPVGTSLTAGFRAAGELLARISPDRRADRSEHPFGYQDETSVRSPSFTLRALQARCTGPVLEIYRLERGD